MQWRSQAVQGLCSDTLSKTRGSNTACNADCSGGGNAVWLAGGRAMQEAVVEAMQAAKGSSWSSHCKLQYRVHAIGYVGGFAG